MNLLYDIEVYGSIDFPGIKQTLPVGSSCCNQHNILVYKHLYCHYYRDSPLTLITKLKSYIMLYR